MAGVVLQGITRNGLADPGILGINAGAGASRTIHVLLSSKASECRYEQLDVNFNDATIRFYRWNNCAYPDFFICFKKWSSGYAND